MMTSAESAASLELGNMLIFGEEPHPIRSYETPPNGMIGPKKCGEKFPVQKKHHGVLRCLYRGCEMHERDGMGLLDLTQIS